MYVGIDATLTTYLNQTINLLEKHIDNVNMSGGNIGNNFVSGSTAGQISSVGGNVGVGGSYISSSKAHDLATRGGYVGGAYISSSQAQRIGFK